MKYQYRSVDMAANIMLHLSLDERTGRKQLTYLLDQTIKHYRKT